MNAYELRLNFSTNKICSSAECDSSDDLHPVFAAVSVCVYCIVCAFFLFVCLHDHVYPCMCACVCACVPVCVFAHAYVQQCMCVWRWRWRWAGCRGLLLLNRSSVLLIKMHSIPL